VRNGANSTLSLTIALVGPVAAPHPLSRALKFPVWLKTVPPKRAVLPAKQLDAMPFCVFPCW